MAQTSGVEGECGHPLLATPLHERTSLQEHGDGLQTGMLPVLDQLPEHQLRPASLRTQRHDDQRAARSTLVVDGDRSPDGRATAVPAARAERRDRLAVGALVAVQQRVPGELGGAPAAGEGQIRTPALVAQERRDLAAKPSLVGDQAVAPAVEDEPGARVGGGDHRRAVRHRLEVGETEALVGARHAEHPRGAVELRQFVVAWTCEPLHAGAGLAAVRDDHQPRVRTRRPDVPEERLVQEAAALSPLPGAHEEHKRWAGPLSPPIDREIDGEGKAAGASRSGAGIRG